jgi:signal transduction histidine kinase
MLDRLSHAFTAQRRFLDEVAHELRTPITVVRGHLELMDLDLTDGGPGSQQQHQTRALLFDELDRMSRIVEDLLLLARAERPGFLTLGPANLTDLVVDAAAKAQALGPRHWKVAEVADATVHLDGQRVTQVLMQLAANAVSHTTAGDTIEIGSRLRRGRAVLWVADTGPGVAPAERERIFQCFYQAGTAYPGRTATGIGIGLALVREIAQAHHGAAHVEDAPGGGARFVIDLPAHDPAPALAPHLTTEGTHGDQDSDSRGRGADSRLRREGTAP